MKMFRISIYFAFTKKARKLGGSDGKASPYNAGDPGWEDSLEKEMATHSSTLAWEIPWTDGGASTATVDGVAKTL